MKRWVSFKLLVLAAFFALPISFSFAETTVATSSPDELTDHKARVFDFKGDAKILKTQGGGWQPVTKDMVVEVGDQILTVKDSYVEIVYDSHFLNIAKIDEKTKAEFRSIEPTDVRMEDGTIFSALDGLPPGSNYQISTPTAVAAVRGTHLFTEAAGGQFENVAVTPDSKTETSHVEVNIEGRETFTVSEGAQLKFDENGAGHIGEIDANVLAATGETVSGIKGERQDSQAQMQQESKADGQQEVKGEAEKKEDHKNAPGGPPGGGGDGGGGGHHGSEGAGQEGSGLLSSSPTEGGQPMRGEPFQGEGGMTKPESNAEVLVDSMADTMIPPDGFKAFESEGFSDPRHEGRPGEGRRSEGENGTQMPTGERHFGEPGPFGGEGVSPPRASVEGLMNFLSVGGFGMHSPGEEGGVQPENFTDMAKTMMNDLGFDPQVAEKFSTFMGMAMNHQAQSEGQTGANGEGRNMPPGSMGGDMTGGSPDQASPGSGMGPGSPGGMFPGGGMGGGMNGGIGIAGMGGGGVPVFSAPGGFGPGAMDGGGVFSGGGMPMGDGGFAGAEGFQFMGEGGSFETFDFSGNNSFADGTVGPENFFHMDPNELTRDIAQDIFENIVINHIDEFLSSSNPYYYNVLNVFEQYLTNTIKQNILAGTSASFDLQNFGSNAYVPPADNVAPHNDDHPAGVILGSIDNQQTTVPDYDGRLITGVTFFKVDTGNPEIGSVVNAVYHDIRNQDLSVLQPALPNSGEGHLIVDIDANNPSDPE